MAIGGTKIPLEVNLDLISIPWLLFARPILGGWLRRLYVYTSNTRGMAEVFPPLPPSLLLFFTSIFATHASYNSC